MNCQGITKKGAQCKNKTCSMYCHQHFTLYEHVKGWPLLHEVLNDKMVKTYVHETDLINELKRLIIIHGEHHRLIFITTCEILLKKQHFDFSKCQKFINIILQKLAECPHLMEYTENFKRRFKSGYQQEARQRYVEHIFLSFIGIDMAHHIASFVE